MSRLKRCGRDACPSIRHSSFRRARRSMKPSKMGFAPGSQVTLDNAFKMLMVKSANDLAVTIAEGVSGSVEAFAAEMNSDALGPGHARIAFRQSQWPARPQSCQFGARHGDSRARAAAGFPAACRSFQHRRHENGRAGHPDPQWPDRTLSRRGWHEDRLHLPGRVNLVASATREGRKVIVVVMGDTSARMRTAHAANLLDQAFATSRIRRRGQRSAVGRRRPPDMRGEICTRRSGKAQLEAETEDFGSAIQQDGAAPPPPGNGALIAALPRPVYDPVPVFVGPTPGYQGPVAGPRPANTPIGAIAYAPPADRAAPAPIKPDPKALSMHRASQAKHKAATQAKVHEKPAVKKSAKAEKKPTKAATSKAAKAKTAASKTPPKPSTSPPPRAARRGRIERRVERPAPVRADSRHDHHRLSRRRKNDLAQPASTGSGLGADGRPDQRIRRDRPRSSVRRKDRRRHGHDGVGLLCCTLRGDLIDALENLLRRLDNGRIPQFDRLVIETTGLADPAPVLHTIMSHPYLLLRFRLDGVVTVVDAINGEATLAGSSRGGQASGGRRPAGPFQMRSHFVDRKPASPWRDCANAFRFSIRRRG